MKLKCCKIQFKETDKQCSLSNELPENMKDKLNLSFEKNCYDCLEKVQEFFDDHAKKDNYIEFSNGEAYISESSDIVSESELIDKLKKKHPLSNSDVTGLYPDSQFIFFNKEDIEEIEERTDFFDKFYVQDWKFSIQVKDKVFKAKVNFNRDEHHRLLSHSDFYCDKLCLDEFLPEIDFCYEIRVKDHAFSDGAGRHYGHTEPDFEFIPDEEYSFDEINIEFQSFINEIEQAIQEFINTKINKKGTNNEKSI